MEIKNITTVIIYYNGQVLVNTTNTTESRQYELITCDADVEEIGQVALKIVLGKVIDDTINDIKKFKIEEETRDDSQVTVQYFIYEPQNETILKDNSDVKWLACDNLDQKDWRFPSELKMLTMYLMMKKVAVVTTVDELMNLGRNCFVDSCTTFLKSLGFKEVKDKLVQSWRNCFSFLIRHWPQELLDNDNTEKQFPLLFEFLMPNSWCRSDVILLTEKKVIVFEFKQKDTISAEDITNDVAQVTGYAQSIMNFHRETGCKGMTVSAFLVYTNNSASLTDDVQTRVKSLLEEKKVPVLLPQTFCDAVRKELQDDAPMTDEDCYKWVTSSFYPQPRLKKAALERFGTLYSQDINSTQADYVKKALKTINNIVDRTESKSIIFLSGVPGSGKTLVGLKTMYDNVELNSNDTPIFLSENTLLTDILQSELSAKIEPEAGKSFIEGLTNFNIRAKSPVALCHNIIVVDEAHRVRDNCNGTIESEAELLLATGNRIAQAYDKVTVLCLIGEGQNISPAQKIGLPVWLEALKNHGDWAVHLPNTDSYRKLFDNLLEGKKSWHDELYLGASIRHNFINVHPWIENILTPDLKRARECYRKLCSEGFRCQVFREQDELEKAVKAVKQQDPSGKMGIILSSHCKVRLNKIFEQYGNSCFQPIEWYTEKCRELKCAGTESLVQGIGLDYPIVTFCGDYYIKGNEWEVVREREDTRLADIKTTIKNIYRILLTRSQKELFIYFPIIEQDSQEDRLKDTWEWFCSMMRPDDEETSQA